MALPPGPQTPRFIRMLKLIGRPLEYLEDYYRIYGDIFAVGQNRPPAVVYVNHPDGIQQIFAAEPDRFRSGSGGQVLRFLLGDASLVVLDGDRHLQRRRLLMPPFHGERLRVYHQLICQITQRATASWQTGQTFQVRTLMQEITLSVILQAVFGLQEGDRFNQLKSLLSQMLDALGSPLAASLIFFPALQKDWGAWSPWGRFVRLKQQVDDLIYQEIRERKATGLSDRADILSLLMSARDEAGQPMQEVELRDELMTLLTAGHETTASALTWALYWVHALPEVETKLRAELQQLGDHPDPAEIARLPYLTAVCQETLRIYPITLTTGVRVLTTPMEILGYELPAGTVLFPCTYLVHHNPQLYPQSKQFRPDRFLERQFAPYEFLPFGGGLRYCIGAALALLEMKLVLATLLQHWQFGLIDHRPIKPVRRSLTMAPPAGLSMKVRPLIQQGTEEVLENVK